MYISLKKLTSIGIILSLLFLSGVLAAQTVSAEDIQKNLCGGAELSFADQGTCDSHNTCTQTAKDADGKTICVETQAEQSVNSIIAKVVNVITIIVGVIAVIMVIIGGAKFITSSGDAGRVASARNTILYAIVGLIIVALAQFIVRFVLNKT